MTRYYFFAALTLLATSGDAIGKTGHAASASAKEQIAASKFDWSITINRENGPLVEVYSNAEIIPLLEREFKLEGTGVSCNIEFSSETREGLKGMGSYYTESMEINCAYKGLRISAGPVVCSLFKDPFYNREGGDRIAFEQILPRKERHKQKYEHIEFGCSRKVQ
ncbi:MAG: hypothetical protein HUU37_04305 [Bdellovibrionales bacterium]|nr:hypothetical protein [Bdellovibrionales bacterium]